MSFFEIPGNHAKKINTRNTELRVCHCSDKEMKYLLKATTRKRENAFFSYIEETIRKKRSSKENISLPPSYYWLDKQRPWNFTTMGLENTIPCHVLETISLNNNVEQRVCMTVLQVQNQPKWNKAEDFTCKINPRASYVCHLITGEMLFGLVSSFLYNENHIQACLAGCLVNKWCVYI